MEISQVLDKIRKLLRLADRAGCPEEAAAAAAAAQRLQDDIYITSGSNARHGTKLIGRVDAELACGSPRFTPKEAKS